MGKRMAKSYFARSFWGVVNATAPVPVLLMVGVDVLLPVIVWEKVSVFVSVVTTSATGFPFTSFGCGVVVVLVYSPVNVTVYFIDFPEVIFQHELSHCTCMLDSCALL